MGESRRRRRRAAHARARHPATTAHLTGPLYRRVLATRVTLTPEWRRDFMIQKAPDAWRGPDSRSPRVDGLDPPAADSELGRCGLARARAGRGVKSGPALTTAAFPAAILSWVRPGCVRPARAPRSSSAPATRSSQDRRKATARRHRLCDSQSLSGSPCRYWRWRSISVSRCTWVCAVLGGRPRDCRASQHSPTNA